MWRLSLHRRPVWCNSPSQPGWESLFCNLSSFASAPAPLLVLSPQHDPPQFSLPISEASQGHRAQEEGTEQDCPVCLWSPEGTVGNAPFFLFKMEPSTCPEAGGRTTWHLCSLPVLRFWKTVGCARTDYSLT